MSERGRLESKFYIHLLLLFDKLLNGLPGLEGLCHI